MKRLVPILLVFVLTFALSAQEELPTVDDLEAGEWHMLAPGGDTVCSNDTPFSFFVYPNERENLMVYLQGGGACWFGDICDLSVNPTYDPFVDESDNPANASGIFDFTNEANPFMDYSMVFIPYCTADVHIGNSSTTYESSAGEVTIQHNGFNNVSAVLDWTFANYESPETVFVAGSSAGAIPSPFYAEYVAEAYPEARIEVLGDGAGGYRTPEAAPVIFGAWNTLDITSDLYADYTLETLDFEAFYIEVGEEYPDISMTQYNTANDEVQLDFLALTGIPDADLPGLLSANFADIEAAVEDFAYYTAGGDVHTILTLPEFYVYAVDGVPFTEWVADLEAGEEVETLACDDCEEPELVEGAEMSMEEATEATAEPEMDTDADDE
jgi:hypothetical protein